MKMPILETDHNAMDGEQGGLIVRIAGLLPSLSPAEQLVGQLVVSDPAAAARHTITELADAAGASEATVVRFCRAVGVRGYTQLRIRLAAEAARRIEPPSPQVVDEDALPGSDMNRIIATIAFNDTRAVQDTADQLDPEVCERAVSALAAAARVDLFGSGPSGLVAADFQQKLHRIGRTAFYWPDTHVALTSAALLGESDVAFGISHSGATADCVEALAEARRRGATTIALTNFPRSPIAEVADLVLTTSTRESAHRSGATSSRWAQLTVMDCLFIGVAGKDQDQTHQHLSAVTEAAGPRLISQGRRRGPHRVLDRRLDRTTAGRILNRQPILLAASSLTANNEHPTTNGTESSVAQKVNVVLVDDLDGGQANETVTFGLDGINYEIDLSDNHATALRDEIHKYVEAARKVNGSRNRAATRGSHRPAPPTRRLSRERAQQIRKWAKANGIEIPDRGRISMNVVARYEEATAAATAGS